MPLCVYALQKYRLLVSERSPEMQIPWESETMH